MCVRLLVVAVLTVCLSSHTQCNAQSQDYHEEDSEGESEREREIAQPVGVTETEIQQERLRLAALEAELREELKLARNGGGYTEQDGPGAIPGLAGQDYPAFTTVPRTSFTCVGKLVPGYYADIQARCQVFHICDASGAKHSFLCPRGSLFNQKYLVCDWWYTSECGSADGLLYQHDFNRIDSGKDTQQEYIHQTDVQEHNQYFPNEDNYILVEPDIFQSAETGVPNREKYESSRDKNETTPSESKRVLDGNAGNNTRKIENTKLNQRNKPQENVNTDYF
ncbi:uncharacterized protein LOC128993232 [Macrosteles quadrilineatus]|uniref:uncharacterized protein LOC128993232 n=1 Tax=Macrosteles quadrilineatus TaxID=74068 RepID=UPI0023E09350|nr:uncharacterized protein LOC128993232 [Macrosteles quadrilineatus]